MSNIVSEVVAKLAKLDTKTEEGRAKVIAYIREVREKISLEAHAKRDEARQLSKLLLKYEPAIDHASRRRRRGAGYEIVPAKKPAGKKPTA